MTVEEAIEIWQSGGGFCPRMVSAINTVINAKFKALSQQTEDVECKNTKCQYYINPDYTRCKECEAEKETHKQQTEDTISRQMALREFEKDQYRLEYCKEHGIDRSISMEMVRIRLHDLPPVTPKQKIGHWVDGHCDICGCDVPAYIIDWKWQKDMNAKFCPNCGAKMEELA